ncbi:piggyBac transposable element-derived protein 4-like [Gigantopelta aegis]|uniref:piggyBac transposable element-derived protein 4-like n=1 Tax=Gigantopelta aegis TaxID=1735272 RepID=UPI001B888C14|nr:piggyBac transposable element-derived protein 4-like [Gigantopelta aegis]
MHRIEMVNVRNRNDKLSRKPNTVQDYNNGMDGVDRSDQMLSYYSVLRKTIRWYKKIVLHILQVFLLNAHILYNTNNREQMKLLKFRDQIHLLGDVYEKLRDHSPAHSQAPVNETFHYLAPLPPTEKKERATKPCRVCTKAGTRRESHYICEVCPGKPALCVGKCFKVYHMSE